MCELSGKHVHQGSVAVADLLPSFAIDQHMGANGHKHPLAMVDLVLTIDVQTIARLTLRKLPNPVHLRLAREANGLRLGVIVIIHWDREQTFLWDGLHSARQLVIICPPEEVTNSGNLA